MAPDSCRNKSGETGGDDAKKQEPVLNGTRVTSWRVCPLSHSLSITIVTKLLTGAWKEVPGSIICVLLFNT